jgi:hypothetical protein
MEMVTVPLYLLYWVPIEYVKSLFCLDSACALPTRPDASSPVSGDRVELPTQHFIAHFLSLSNYTVLSPLSFSLFLCHPFLLANNFLAAIFVLAVWFFQHIFTSMSDSLFYPFHSFNLYSNPQRLGIQ